MRRCRMRCGYFWIGAFLLKLFILMLVSILTWVTAIAQVTKQ